MKTACSIIKIFLKLNENDISKNIKQIVLNTASNVFHGKYVENLPRILLFCGNEITRFDANIVQHFNIRDTFNMSAMCMLSFDPIKWLERRTMSL